MHGMPKISIEIWRDCAKIWFGMTGLENPIGTPSGRSRPRTLSLTPLLGSLNNDDGDGNENGKKAIGLDQQKQHRCTCTLFCPFLCRRCTTTTWNCLISRYVDDVKTNSKRRPSFSFPELCYSSLEFSSKKFHIWRIVWAGVRAIIRLTGRENTLIFNWHFRSLPGTREGKKIINERSKPREVSRLASLPDIFSIWPRFLPSSPSAEPGPRLFSSRRCCRERAWPRATRSVWKSAYEMPTAT